MIHNKNHLKKRKKKVYFIKQLRFFFVSQIICSGLLESDVNSLRKIDKNYIKGYNKTKKFSLIFTVFNRLYQAPRIRRVNSTFSFFYLTKIKLNFAKSFSLLNNHYIKLISSRYKVLDL